MCELGGTKGSPKSLSIARAIIALISCAETTIAQHPQQWYHCDGHPHKRTRQADRPQIPSEVQEGIRSVHKEEGMCVRMFT